MGKSTRWRVTSGKGERQIRVQNAYHSGRVRIFVDEALFHERNEAYALWDEGWIYAFDLDGLECVLEVSGSRGASLSVAGKPQEPDASLRT